MNFFTVLISSFVFLSFKYRCVEGALLVKDSELVYRWIADSCAPENVTVYEKSKFGKPAMYNVHLGISGNHWGLCALRHGIQISMEAILACHPARSTE